MVDMDRSIECAECGPTIDEQPSLHVGRTAGGQWVSLEPIPEHAGRRYRQTGLCCGDRAAALEQALADGAIVLCEGGPPGCKVAFQV